MHDAPLLLDVAGQAVRADPLGQAEHHDVVPLLALDPVDGGEGHPACVGGLSQVGAQPDLEGGHLVVEVGQLQQGLEVVEVGAALAALRRVEEAHGLAEADVVADEGQRVADAALGGSGQALEVRRHRHEVLALAVLLQRVRELAQRAHRPRPPALQAVG